MHFGSETDRMPAGHWGRDLIGWFLRLEKKTKSPPAGPYFEKLGARALRNVAFGYQLSALLR
jgi:hypothetical protein